MKQSINISQYKKLFNCKNTAEVLLHCINNSISISSISFNVRDDLNIINEQQILTTLNKMEKPLRTECLEIVYILANKKNLASNGLYKREQKSLDIYKMASYINKNLPEFKSIFYENLIMVDKISDFLIFPPNSVIIEQYLPIYKQNSVDRDLIASQESLSTVVSIISEIEKFYPEKSENLFLFLNKKFSKQTSLNTIKTIDQRLDLLKDLITIKPRANI